MSTFSENHHAASMFELGLDSHDNEQRYIIGELVAKGGMGLIYSAYDKKTNREVAYKVILPELADKVQSLQRFAYEAEVAALLEHPHIMPVYDIGEDSDGRAYYTMKLLHGETLAAKIDGLHAKQDFHQWRHLVEILIKVCEALSYAHEKNIVHRDLKPENIMIGQFGEVLVLDWGLAKANKTFDQSSSDEVLQTISHTGLSQYGSVVGTLAYMSPEQASGEQVNQVSDIYSIGAIFYHMLTLNAPINEKDKAKALEIVKQGNIPSIKCSKHSPPSAIALCKKAMAVQTAERYQSLEEVLSELHKLSKGVAVRAEEASAFRLVQLFLKRHSAISAMCFGFLMIIGLLSHHFYQRLQEENTRVKKASQEARIQEKRAKVNLKQAQKALENLQATAPVYLEQARHKIDNSLFDEALTDIKTYLKLNNNNADAFILLGRINQAKKQFKEAEQAYIQAQSCAPADLRCSTGIEISRKAWQSQAHNTWSTPGELYSVYQDLIANKQFPEAAALLDDILKNRGKRIQVFSQLFKESGLKGRITFSKSGASMSLDLSGHDQDLSTLKYFKKFNIYKLNISGNKLASLEPIKGLSIRHLDISHTRIASLEALKNTPLQSLNCAYSKVHSLKGIQGRSFTRLDLSACPLKKLDSLIDIHGKRLILAASPAKLPKYTAFLNNNFQKLTLPKAWQGHFQEENNIHWDLKEPIIVQ